MLFTSVSLHLCNELVALLRSVCADLLNLPEHHSLCWSVLVSRTLDLNLHDRTLSGPQVVCKTVNMHTLYFPLKMEKKTKGDVGVQVAPKAQSPSPPPPVQRPKRGPGACDLRLSQSICSFYLFVYIYILF